MSALSWLLFAGCCGASGVLGWVMRSWRQEVLDTRAEAQRDAEWDRQHGIGDQS